MDTGHGTNRDLHICSVYVTSKIRTTSDLWMVVLGKSDSKVKLSVNKLYTDMRVEWSVVGWNFKNSQLAIVEG